MLKLFSKTTLPKNTIAVMQTITKVKIRKSCRPLNIIALEIRKGTWRLPTCTNAAPAKADITPTISIACISSFHHITQKVIRNVIQLPTEIINNLNCPNSIPSPSGATEVVHTGAHSSLWKQLRCTKEKTIDQS